MPCRPRPRRSGSPSRTGRRRGSGSEVGDARCSRANVPTASSPGHRESFWVTPCWRGSPSTTSRIRSNGWSGVSSRRPTSRVSRNMKREQGRRGRRPIREHRQVSVDGQEPARRRRARRRRAPADVGRVDLELDEQDVLRPAGRWPKSSTRRPLRPASIGDGSTVLIVIPLIQPSSSSSVARLSSGWAAIVKRASQISPPRTAPGESTCSVAASRGRARGRGALAEDVEESQQREDDDEPEQAPAHPHLPAPADADHGAGEGRSRRVRPPPRRFRAGG